MAMSDATSGPAHWAQLGGWPHLQPPHPSAGVSDSIVVSTTSSPTISGPAKAGGGGATTAQQPGIEGRVGKPLRRRSRASRRAPTTMLNTDTANFRSMVQQFTGIPSGPYSAGYRPAGRGGPGPVSNVSYNFNDPMHQPTLMSFGHLQQHQYRQQQQQQQNYQSSDHTMFTATVGNNNSGSGGGSDALLQGFNNSGTNLEATADGFFFDGMYNQTMPRPTSTINRGDGYF